MENLKGALKVAEWDEPLVILTVHQRIKVFEVRGRLARTLIKRHVEPGNHRASWDGRRDSGRSAAGRVYFCRLDASDGSRVRKMVLQRIRTFSYHNYSLLL